MISRNILSIETSCDETSIALVKCSGTLKTPRFEVLENIVSSQIAVHRPFGGVVPNLAKREHLKNLPKILANLTKKCKDLKTKIDYIAVTVGPGLEPALWTGITFAQDLAKKINKPLIGVNHMEGHLYSNWLPQSYEASPRKIVFPAIALIVSGGHTILLKMKAINKWAKLGETVDDAAGEAFDKVARMLRLPYPGGPEIERLVLSLPKGQKPSIEFPRPLLNPKNIKDKYNFSFSGLKTSVLYYLRDNPKVKKADVAASFQQATIDVLVKKTARAAEEYNAKSILLCGGVSANEPLQKTLRAAAYNLQINFSVPDFKYNTDNAAMIGAAAYINLIDKKKSRLGIEAQANLNL